MQAEAAHGIFTRAVPLVANDGMAGPLAMNADLMFFPRFENEFHVGVFGGAADHFEMGDRHFSFGRFDDRKTGGFEKWALPRSPVFFQTPFDDGEILSLQIVRFEHLVEFFCRFFAAGEQKNSRGFPVDPVNREDLIGAEVFAQKSQSVPFRSPVIEGNAQEADRFIDRDQIPVFVDDRNAGNAGRPERLLRAEGLPGLQDSAFFSDGRPVDRKAPCLQPILERAARAIGIDFFEGLDDGERRCRGKFHAG